MSTFNELIDFTRSTTGTYLDSVVYGDEVAPALDFNVGNNWNNGGSPTAITYNSFSTVGSGAGYFANAFEVGKTYLRRSNRVVFKFTCRCKPRSRQSILMHPKSS